MVIPLPAQPNLDSEIETNIETGITTITTTDNTELTEEEKEDIDIDMIDTDSINTPNFAGVGFAVRVAAVADVAGSTATDKASTTTPTDNIDLDRRLSLQVSPLHLQILQQQRRQRELIETYQRTPKGPSARAMEIGQKILVIDPFNTSSLTHSLALRDTTT